MMKSHHIPCLDFQTRWFKTLPWTFNEENCCPKSICLFLHQNCIEMVNHAENHLISSLSNHLWFRSHPSHINGWKCFRKKSTQKCYPKWFKYRYFSWMVGATKGQKKLIQLSFEWVVFFLCIRAIDVVETAWKKNEKKEEYKKLSGHEYFICWLFLSILFRGHFDHFETHMAMNPYIIQMRIEWMLIWRLLHHSGLQWFTRNSKLKICVLFLPTLYTCLKKLNLSRYS